MHLEYFQMVDRIEAIDAEAGTVAVRSVVPSASPIFEGHFPNHPLMPGVLLIETMAQTSGFLLMARQGFAKLPFLVNVKDAKLRTFVEPEAVLDATAELEHDGSGFAVTKAAIRSEGKRICDARLTFRVMDFPDPDLGELVRRRGAEVGMPERYLSAEPA